MFDLAGRKTGGYIDGDIKVSGYPKKQETFARIFGYCEQNDIHSPHVTVYESLLYSTWLRLPAGVDTKTRERNKQFIQELGKPAPGSKDLHFASQSVFLGPMLDMLMETTLVILAQSTIHCCEVFLHYIHSRNVWNNVLGPWWQTRKSTRPVERCGFDVYCCSLPSSTKFFFCAASCCS
ncbi:unnamed protein product [Trifolium pratense]|uniref:Uncharacterized protein n=1 Tax=Trifolium pratense TaxID=57577 RepID=A0ACB0KVW3_TRIPR|nr:unnamed protein product [Trifolium pratense]